MVSDGKGVCAPATRAVQRVPTGQLACTLMNRTVLIALSLVAAPAPAMSSDRALLTAVDRGVGPTAAASRAAAGGSPAAVQRLYDRARDLQEQVRAAAPFSAACNRLGGWAARYAAAEVAAAEGFDRLEPARARRFRAVAVSARARVDAAWPLCRPATARPATTPPGLREPLPGAASFGEVVATAPASADGAALFANGRPAGTLAIAGGRATARLVGEPGRYDLEVRFTQRGAAVGVARSAGVWLLPESAAGPVRAPDLDAAWQTQVRDAAGRFGGISAVWVHELATGRAASFNAGALFPAASMVKLGVMVEALRRMGLRPDASALAHDVRAIGAWSSNLGANRLLSRVGGSSSVQAALRRMGAVASTYTGPYIVATGRPPVDAPRQPPRVSRRVTSASDLGAVLGVVHEAAAGDAGALAATRMTRIQARQALGMLLSSEAAGDNLGLFREALGPGVPAAQKHGWISSARHSAAVVYGPRGPVILVALTYQPGLPRAAAARFGAELVTIATG